MNHTTWRSKMNLAIRGIDSDKWNSEGTFRDNAFPHERFDYVMANPPFYFRMGQACGGGYCAGNTARHPMAPNYAWLNITHIWPRTAPPASCWPTGR